MDEYIVGIDFGASSVKVVKDDGGSLREIPLSTKDEQKDLPNFICYRPKKNSGEIQKIIGKRAAGYAVTEPQNVISWIKRKMLLANWTKKISSLSREVTAWEAAQDVFAEVRRRIYSKTERDRQIKAILTVPVNFSILQRNKLKKIAEDAEIAVEQIITEPFAALFSLKDIFELENQLAFIFDFGASTLDVSIVKIDCGEKFSVRELAAAGLNLGGIDIDEAIAEKIIKPQYKNKIDASTENKILECARAVKEEIFGGDLDETEDYIFEESVTVTREQLIKLFEAENYKGRIAEMLDGLFEDLSEGDDGFEAGDVTMILPFGGTSHISYFMELLAEYFGGKFDAQNFSFEDNDVLCKGLKNRLMAVAGGAVIYKKILDSGKETEIENAIPFRIGIEQAGKFIPCLGKNMPRSFKASVPLNISEILSAGWKVKIYQSFSYDGVKIDKIEGNDEGISFIGELDLNAALYNHEKDILLEMSVAEGETLLIRLYQLQFIDDEFERAMIEEKIFAIGG